MAMVGVNELNPSHLNLKQLVFSSLTFSVHEVLRMFEDENLRC